MELSNTHELLASKYMSVQRLNDGHTLLCEAKKEYIPIESFKSTFEQIATIVQDNTVEKLIFDKRKLTTFHQGSMEWYHVNWKPKMLNLGLKSYRKLLPDNDIFRKSVEVGREVIRKNNPNFSFEDFDIVYCETISEAIEQ